MNTQYAVTEPAQEIWTRRRSRFAKTAANAALDSRSRSRIVSSIARAFQRSLLFQSDGGKIRVTSTVK